MKTISTSKVKGKEASVPRPMLLLPRHRSKLEGGIETQLIEAAVKFSYESEKIKYTIPERAAKYTPDFIIEYGNGQKMYIEAKGYFHKLDERKKLELVKAQYPDIDLRVVFQDSSNRIYKGSPTTYAKWADSHGIPWSDGGIIPATWLKEVA